MECDHNEFVFFVDYHGTDSFWFRKVEEHGNRLIFEPWGHKLLHAVIPFTLFLLKFAKRLSQASSSPYSGDILSVS
jgi:hypothetical protein